MKKTLKIILITIIVIAVLCTAGAILYKPVYNVVAPVVFDKFVAKNLDKFINLKEDDNEANKEEKGEISSENTDNENDDKAEDEKKEENEKKDDKLYSTKTTNGVYTSNDLSYLLKVISPQDKSQIISILQSCVASSDYPDMAKRVSDGLDNADMAYIESYLRARMTPQQKKAILDIVAKYF